MARRGFFCCGAAKVTDAEPGTGVAAARFQGTWQGQSDSEPLSLAAAIPQGSYRGDSSQGWAPHRLGLPETQRPDRRSEGVARQAHGVLPVDLGPVSCRLPQVHLHEWNHVLPCVGPCGAGGPSASAEAVALVQSSFASSLRTRLLFERVSYQGGLR